MSKYSSNVSYGGGRDDKNNRDGPGRGPGRGFGTKEYRDMWKAAIKCKRCRINPIKDDELYTSQLCESCLQFQRGQQAQQRQQEAVRERGPRKKPRMGEEK